MKIARVNSNSYQESYTTLKLLLRETPLSLSSLCPIFLLNWMNKQFIIIKYNFTSLSNMILMNVYQSFEEKQGKNI